MGQEWRLMTAVAAVASQSDPSSHRCCPNCQGKGTILRRGTSALALIRSRSEDIIAIADELAGGRDDPGLFEQTIEAGGVRCVIHGGRRPVECPLCAWQRAQHIERYVM